MASNEELKVLIVHDDQNEANRLTSLLRNAKYRVTPTYTRDPKAIIKLMEEKPFDLILSQHESESIPGKDIFTILRRLNLDLPVIQICADKSFEKITEGMKLGSYATIPMDEDQLLLLTIARILYNLGQRRGLRYWKRRYMESESRCQRLLGSSRDAIAIVQDGTYTYANEAYANLFGFIDPEGMSCLPVIDTIAPDDHPRMKKFLKPLDPEEEPEKQVVTFTGVSGDDTPIPVECQVSRVDFDSEPALQFLIPMEDLAGSDVSQISRLTHAGAPIQRHRTLEHIDNAINQAATQGNLSTLIYICIDRYHDLQEEIGYQAMEKLVISLIERLEAQIDDAHSFDRFKEESLILLVKGASINHAAQLAENLCQAAREKPIEVDDQTFDITLSIGISGISEAVTSPEGCIFRCLQAITELQADQEQANYGNGVKIYEADIKTAAKTSFNVEELGDTLLDKNLFVLFYQPLVPLHGEPSEFYEVLLRVSPEGNPEDLPEDFIDQLFRSKVAGKIDRWVIMESFKALSEKTKSDPETRLFINLADATICDSGFIPWLKVAMKASNISPKQLIFQIREIDVGRHRNQATKLISDLAAIKSLTSLSHFGRAIDPLQMLATVCFDFVKLDSTIIDKTQRNRENHLEDIEDLLGGLKHTDCQVIIPHVENASMIPALWYHGIDYIQGNFVRPPAAKMDFDFQDEQ